MSRLRLPLLFVLALLAGCSGDDSPAAAPTNAAPRIVDCDAAPSRLAPGGESTFTVSVEDDDGDAVSVTWTADGGAFPDGAEGASVRWTAPTGAGPVQAIAAAHDGAATVRDTLTVQVVAEPVLWVEPSALDYGWDTDALTFTVSNPGTGDLAWTAAPSAGWIALDATAGSQTDAAAVVTATVDRAGLAAGDHAAAVTVSSAAGDADVSVALVVPAPELAVAPSALDFDDAGTQLGLVVTNAGTGELNWTASTAAAWLDLQPAAGAVTDGSAAIALTADRVGLAPGDHAAVVRVESDGGAVDVPVALRVPTPDPVLGVSTSRIDFGETATERLLQVTNDGGGTLDWTLTTAADWLDFSPASGSSTGESDLITATADRAGLSAGRHATTLVITTNGGDRVLDVTVDVTDGPVVLRNLFFLHHSTGRNLIAEGDVRAELAAIDPALEFWDHDYNPIGIMNPAGVLTGDDYSIPNDNTDPDGLHFLWTTQNTARLEILQNHQVIAFKSCYPASNITSDAMLAQYKTWYLEMRDVFDQYPDHVFLVMSQPPRHRLRTDTAEATRARAFADWLGSAEYLDGHPNVRFFDFFDHLANPDDGSDTANMLQWDYERSHSDGDSHPNTHANETVGPHFARALADAAGL